jgi:hypothetical protein
MSFSLGDLVKIKDQRCKYGPIVEIDGSNVVIESCNGSKQRYHIDEIEDL